MLKVYNSLTQRKESLTLKHPGKVSMYVCGPTVYDYAHIGNARSFTAFDVIVRYLRHRNYEVNYVRNITDIDDKIIHRAKQNGEKTDEMVDRYIKIFHEDMTKLNLLEPTHEPRATQYIPQIISFIEKLMKNEYAYVAKNGDVYYAVRKFKKYGCLSHRNIDELESGARIEVSDVKRDPLDFVLWKMAKPDEPKWDSPWGAGRPGWHIECSAMATELLGHHFDIHGGGKDLIFPHHENEIAQSEGAHHETFVNLWMHAGYLQIDKEKMSKSLGNFFTIHDLLKKYKPEILRYFLISGQYRSSLNFSENALEQASQALTRLYTSLRNLPDGDPVAEDKFEREFTTAMDDDFNTPIALSVLFELAHEVQRLREQDITLAARYAKLLKHLGGVLGILQDNPEHFLKQSMDIAVDNEQIEKLIAARNQARADKNWKEADRIRDQLSAMSVILEDDAQGTTWKIKS